MQADRFNQFTEPPVADRDPPEVRDPQVRRRREASRWFVVLQEEQLSTRVLRAWKKWEAVPENREAFDEMEQLWRSMEAMPRPPHPTVAEQLIDRYDGSCSVEEWERRERETVESRRHRVPRRYLHLAMAASVVFCIVGIAMVAVAYWRAPAMTLVEVFETTVGEHREIQLSDGSTVHLGARSLVTTNMGTHARTVVLARGEALFTVAHDASRPFKVMSGGGTITAVGTAFNVRRREDSQVIVTVTEGVVQIESNGANLSSSQASRPPARQRRLQHGQQMIYDLRGQFSEPQPADADAAITWRDGRLRYTGEPLRNVVPDVNRYSRRLIVLGDRAAGELLFSGTVFERDVDEWIGNLESVYPALEVTVTDTQSVLIRMKPLLTQDSRQ